MNPRLLSDTALDSLANVADDHADRVIKTLLGHREVGPNDRQAAFGALIGAIMSDGNETVDAFLGKPAPVDGDGAQTEQSQAKQEGEESEPPPAEQDCAGTQPASGAPADLPDSYELFDEVIDCDMVRHAQRFFEDNGIAIITALFHAALPEAYRGMRGVQVLGLTGEFVNNWTRRIQLTGQFLVTVLSPDPDLRKKKVTSLHPGQTGAVAARRVRLRHAAVRWLLDLPYLQDHFEKLFVESIGLDHEGNERSIWSVRMRQINQELPYSRPLNQEDLLGTLGTFTTVTFEALEKMGIPFDEDDRIAYYHLWNVVGMHFGIGDQRAAQNVPVLDEPPAGRWPTNAIFPLNPDEMDALFERIRKRLGGRTEEGIRLTKTLVQEMSRPLPGPMQGAPAFLVRYFIGDAAADQLEVDAGGYGQLFVRRTGLLGQLAKRTRANPFGQVMVSALSSAITRYALRAYITQTQGVDPGFTIDPGIANRWGIQTGPQISAPLTS